MILFQLDLPVETNKTYLASIEGQETIDRAIGKGAGEGRKSQGEGLGGVVVLGQGLAVVPEKW